MESGDRKIAAKNSEVIEILDDDHIGDDTMKEDNSMGDTPGSPYPLRNRKRHYDADDNSDEVVLARPTKRLKGFYSWWKEDIDCGRFVLRLSSHKTKFHTIKVCMDCIITDVFARATNVLEFNLK